MIHRLADFFNPSVDKKEDTTNRLTSPNKNKNLSPKPRKKRFNYKEKNWRRDIISVEIFILIIFIFLPVIFYITGHMKFNF